MNNVDIEGILKLSCEERYEVFLDLVADERELWILVSEDKQFLIIHSADDDMEFLPVWPSVEFAMHYCNNLDEKLSPKSIALPEFFTKWVKGLESDAIQVSVFPNSEEDVWIMEPSELKSDLQDAISNFGF